MIARHTLLALSLLAGVGLLAATPARAGHDRTTVIYRVGGYDREYRPVERHREWRHEHVRRYDRHHGGYHRHRWERARYSTYRAYRHHDRDEPRYRIHLEFGN